MKKDNCPICGLINKHHRLCSRVQNFCFYRDGKVYMTKTGRKKYRGFRLFSSGQITRQ